MRLANITHSAKSLEKATINAVIPLMKDFRNVIQYTAKIKKFYSEVYDEIIDISKKNNNYGLQGIIDRLKKGIQKKTLSIIKDKWSGLDKKTMKKFLYDLSEVHYQTLMAAFRRMGQYKSRGKSGTVVNIPEAIGVYVVEPLSTYMNEIALKKLIEESRISITENRENFQNLIENLIIRENFDQDDDFFNSFESRIYATLDQYHADVENICQDAFENVDDLEIDVVDIAYDSLGFSLDSIFNVGLDEKGRGARQRALDDIAELTPKMLPHIAQKGAETFADLIYEELQARIDRIENKLSDAQSEVSKKIEDMNKIIESDFSSEKKKELADQLEESLTKILD